MIAAGGFQIPTQDPFDHSQCDHPTPVFPVEITPELQVDLVNVLHVIWLAIVQLDLQGVIDFVDDLGRWVEMAALGYGDVVDREVQNTKATAKDMKTLHNKDAFDAELRALLEGNNGNDH